MPGWRIGLGLIGLGELASMDGRKKRRRRASGRGFIRLTEAELGGGSWVLGDDEGVVVVNGSTKNEATLMHLQQ